jgi:hypothetical protein
MLKFILIKAMRRSRTRYQNLYLVILVGVTSVTFKWAKIHATNVDIRSFGKCNHEGSRATTLLSFDPRMERPMKVCEQA